MTKERDEGYEHRGPAVYYSNADYFHDPTPRKRAYDNASNTVDLIRKYGADDREVCKDHLGREDVSGFIFMCNGRTKPECYLNRVFGLPIARKQVIEKIRPGMKLFLFDYEVKYLYGVYEATTAGTLNLERMAFGGRFPAQVRFKIHKECLPLPETDFRYVLQDNYQKGSNKFNTVLNSRQVNHLLSLFHPITKQSSTQYASSYTNDQFPAPAMLLSSDSSSYLNRPSPSHAPQVLVPQHGPHRVLRQQSDSHGHTGNTGLSRYSVDSQPGILMENQLQSSPILASTYDPNAARVYGGLTLPVLAPQYVQPSVLHPQLASYGYTANMGYYNPAVQQQAVWASTQTYHSAEFEQPYLPEIPSQQAPESYESYYNCEAAQDRAPTDQYTDSGYGYNQLSTQVGTIQQVNAAEHHHPNQVPTAPHAAEHTLMSQVPEVAAGSVPMSSSYYY